MDLTNEFKDVDYALADKYLIWIIKEMEFERWYNVKSAPQRTAIEYLIAGEWIKNVEFNEDYTQIRKVDWDFKTKPLLKLKGE